MQTTDQTAHDQNTRVRVWDLPLRLFHWALVACIIGSYVTANVGGLWMDYHFQFGYAILTLLVFRLIWGFVGPEHARFSSFLRGPAAIMAYVRARGRMPAAGHNPLGAVSVIVMLVLLVIQVGTGLFATDGILSEGPLARYVSSSTADTLTAIHQTNRVLLLIIIALHLLAIAWYGVVRRQPLLRAMITGNKPAAQVPAGTRPANDSPRTWMQGLVVLLVSLAVAWWIVNF